MSVQYLIDYENVHEIGLYGIKALPMEDSVYIFHTSSTDRITLSSLDDVQAWVRVILVPPGKQSLDMHLASFLGYLIGKEDDGQTQYVIVSNDGDYRGITSFWNQSYQTDDKVVCTDCIWSHMNNVNLHVFTEQTGNCTVAEQIAIRNFVFETFSKNGIIGLNGLPCMLVSELCTRLNELNVYNIARNRLSKKPMQFLKEECHDYLQITKQWSQDWVYLMTENVAEDSAMVALSIDSQVEPDVLEGETAQDIMEILEVKADDEQFVVEESMKVSSSADDEKEAAIYIQEEGVVVTNEMDHSDEENANEIKETVPTPAQREWRIEEVPVEEMKLSVRSTNSLRRAGYGKAGEFIYLPDQELLKTRNLGQKGVDEIRNWMKKQKKNTSYSVLTERQRKGNNGQNELPSATDELKNEAIIASVIALFKNPDDNIEKDENGNLRVSAIRDILMVYPEFRLAVKKSGLKPIAFLQQLLDGKIDIYRNKGVYWACMADYAKCNTELKDEPIITKREIIIAERKQNFYQQAFSNIQKRLSNAGLEKEVANEIASIFMRSNTATEPRKVIHTLLCQRFGTQLGAKYYRETVKYVEV